MVHNLLPFYGSNVQGGIEILLLFFFLLLLHLPLCWSGSLSIGYMHSPYSGAYGACVHTLHVHVPYMHVVYPSLSPTLPPSSSFFSPSLSPSFRPGQPKVLCLPETRVWNKVGSDWKCVHTHRSEGAHWPSAAPYWAAATPFVGATLQIAWGLIATDLEHKY